MKRFVFKGVLAARTNRNFWPQRHYADPPERPSYQPHTTEGVISGMKSEQTSRFSVIVRIPIGTPKLGDLKTCFKFCQILDINSLRNLALPSSGFNSDH